VKPSSIVESENRNAMTVAATTSSRRNGTLVMARLRVSEGEGKDNEGLQVPGARIVGSGRRMDGRGWF